MTKAWRFFDLGLIMKIRNDLDILDCHKVNLFLTCSDCVRVLFEIIASSPVYSGLIWSSLSGGQDGVHMSSVSQPQYPLFRHIFRGSSGPPVDVGTLLETRTRPTSYVQFFQLFIKQIALLSTLVWGRCRKMNYRHRTSRSFDGELIAKFYLRRVFKQDECRRIARYPSVSQSWFRRICVQVLLIWSVLWYQLIFVVVENVTYDGKNTDVGVSSFTTVKRSGWMSYGELDVPVGSQERNHCLVHCRCRNV